MWVQEDSQLYRAQGMHSLLEELGIEHGYRELEGVGHESGRIYPFSAMVRTVPACHRGGICSSPSFCCQRSSSLLLLLLAFGFDHGGSWVPD